MNFTAIYWDYIGIKENNMEITSMLRLYRDKLFGPHDNCSVHENST